MAYRTKKIYFVIHRTKICSMKIYVCSMNHSIILLAPMSHKPGTNNTEITIAWVFKQSTNSLIVLNAVFIDVCINILRCIKIE